MKLRRQKQKMFFRNSTRSLTPSQRLGSGSRSPLPWCCLRTLSEATLESARHVTQVPHPSCSGSLSPNGLRAPVIFSCARSGESTRRTPTLLKVEAPMTTPHTERVSLVPPLTETPCSFPHCSSESETLVGGSLYPNIINYV